MSLSIHAYAKDAAIIENKRSYMPYIYIILPIYSRIVAN